MLRKMIGPGDDRPLKSAFPAVGSDILVGCETTRTEEQKQEKIEKIENITVHCTWKYKY